MKRKGHRAKERTKCCRTETGRFSSSVLHSSSLQVSGGSRCSEERPCASGSTSILFPFRTRMSRHQHLFTGLFGCNHSCTSSSVRHLLIYTFTFVSLLSSCPFASSVLTGRVPVLLCSFITGRQSLSFPSYHLLFGSRPRWSRLVSPRTCVITRQRTLCFSTHEPVVVVNVDLHSLNSQDTFYHSTNSKPVLRFVPHSRIPCPRSP